MDGVQGLAGPVQKVVGTGSRTPLAVGVAAGEQGRLRLARAILGDHGLDLVAEAPSLEELAQSGATPDVVVLEGPARRDQIAEARRVFAGAILIVIAREVAPQQLRTALAEGADGIVMTERLEQSLTATIHAAQAGQVAIPYELRASIVRPSLSTREKQVLGLVVMGFTNGEIARKLVLAESTVKSHLSSSFSKLGVRSRNEAAALILDSGSGLGTGILAISGGDESNGP
jgi:DNA-binding NarL/FixJ family response regulator